MAFKIVDLSVSVGEDIAKITKSGGLGLKCRPGGSYGCSGSNSTAITCIGRSVRRFYSDLGMRAMIDEKDLDALRKDVGAIVSKYSSK